MVAGFPKNVLIGSFFIYNLTEDFHLTLLCFRQNCALSRYYLPVEYEIHLPFFTEECSAKEKSTLTPLSEKTFSFTLVR